MRVATSILPARKQLAYFPHPLATVSPRDLLLLELLEPSPDELALEVGTGSGSSLFRLAPLVRELHGADVSTAPVRRLARFAEKSRGPAARVRLFVHDFCTPGLAGSFADRYDLILSCDTLEHVRDPAAFLANVHDLLRPGGRAFITFPNEHPRRAHGITYFERRIQLERLLDEAGFARADVLLASVRMNRVAERILNALWRVPRRLAKAALAGWRGARGKPAAAQTFDETDFFNAADRLEFAAPLINAYSWAVMWLMHCARPVYQVDGLPDCIWDKQVLVRAVRPATAARFNGQPASSTAST
ncbi:MAG: class I SAM-dependent methyltransferase [Pirellulales bacterium]